MLNHLDELESKSIYILRETGYHFKNEIGLLWSIGKDSTTLLWLCRKAFFGEIPFPVVHLDTGFKFPQIYKFRDKYVKEWGMNLMVAMNKDAIEKGISPFKDDKLDCCNELKTNALKQIIEREGFKAIIVGIRRDEHGIRAKERYFSPREEGFTWNYSDQPAELWSQYQSELDDGSHLRIHPLLHWTELDIWRYIKREKIPFIDLYLSKEGKRYRSIGCQTCCETVQSDAGDIDSIISELKNAKTGERSGRAQDKEHAFTMQKLRSLGYM